MKSRHDTSGKTLNCFSGHSLWSLRTPQEESVHSGDKPRSRRISPWTSTHTGTDCSSIEETTRNQLHPFKRIPTNIFYPGCQNPFTDPSLKEIPHQDCNFNHQITSEKWCLNISFFTPVTFLEWVSEWMSDCEAASVFGYLAFWVFFVFNIKMEINEYNLSHFMLQDDIDWDRNIEGYKMFGKDRKWGKGGGRRALLINDGINTIERDGLSSGNLDGETV